MKKTWQWKDSISTGNSELILEGEIASDSWWGDEATPKEFRDELNKHTGPITVRINSPGGDVFAGVSMYNALLEYSGEVTVKIDGLAASVASLVAMAGDNIVMLPGAMMMVHQPWTIAMGNADDMKEVADMLEKIGGSITAIYAARTGLSEERVTELLKAETWMDGPNAVELGFATEAKDAKSNLSEAIKNAAAFTETVRSAALQPVMSIKAKLSAAKAEVEQDKQLEPVEKDTDDEVMTEADPSEDIESVDEETMKKTVTNEEAAKAQVMPENQPKPDAPTMSGYLKTKAAVEDFANVLMANAGKSAEDVKNAWNETLQTKMNLTNVDYFALPEPLVSNIETAVKSSGIYNVLNHTGLDVFKAVFDDADADADTSRAGGHNKGDTKDEQVLDFGNRVLRAKYIYKYLALDKETIRENQSSGALVRFVLNELPVRIIREIERAVVIGDGRLVTDKRHITSFIPVKSDVVAENSFAAKYTPASATESHYDSIVKAADLLEADGPVYLVHKKGYLTDIKLEKTASGGYVFTPGVDMDSVLEVAGKFQPTWFKDSTDAEFDAYLVVFDAYKTVGDNSIEAFTDFKLSTNENEFLQETYKGGGLTAVKAAVGIAHVAA